MKVYIQSFADVSVREQRFFIVVKYPVFGFLEDQLCPTTLGEEMFLEARHSILEHSDHKAFFRPKLAAGSNGLKVLIRKIGVGLDWRILSCSLIVTKNIVAHCSHPLSCSLPASVSITAKRPLYSRWSSILDKGGLRQLACQLHHPPVFCSPCETYSSASPRTKWTPLGSERETDDRYRKLLGARKPQPGAEEGKGSYSTKSSDDRHQVLTSSARSTASRTPDSFAQWAQQ